MLNGARRVSIKAQIGTNSACRVLFKLGQNPPDPTLFYFYMQTRATRLQCSNRGRSRLIIDYYY